MSQSSGLVAGLCIGLLATTLGDGCREAKIAIDLENASFGMPIKERFGQGVDGMHAASEFIRTNALYIGTLSWTNTSIPSSHELREMRRAVQAQELALEQLPIGNESK
jgi:hypothetical protein